MLQSIHEAQATRVEQAQQHAHCNALLGRPLQTQPTHEVFMRCVTWTRDSNGLFDYESKNIAKKNIKSNTGGRLVRDEDDV